MDFTLPASAEQLRQAADRFVQEALLPHEGLLPPAEGTLPEDVRHRVTERRRALGLWGLGVPPAAGGMGLGWMERALVQERVQRSLLGLWPQGLLAAGDPPAALHAMRGTQREEYLQPCLDGRRIAHQILLPGGARAGGAPGLRAMPTPEGAVLSGTWTAVPALCTEDVLLVVAEMQGRLQGFLCDRGLPGYRVCRRRPGMGSVELADLAWEDCRLETARILPDAGPAALLWRAAQRVTVFGAGALGAAERCLEIGLDHIRRRQTFGRPLADRQAIQWMVADSARELHGARLLLYRAASLADRGDRDSAQDLAGPAMAYAAEAACRTVDRVLQMHGGYGYTRELPIERFWRDLRFYRVADGSNDTLVADAAGMLVADLSA